MKSAADIAKEILPGEFLPGGLPRKQMAEKQAAIAAAIIAARQEMRSMAAGEMRMYADSLGYSDNAEDRELILAGESAIRSIPLDPNPKGGA